MQVYNTWSLHDHISEEIVIMDACSPRINAWRVCIAQMCQEKGSILQRTPDLQHEEVWGVHQLIWMLLVGVYMVWIYSQTKRLINSWGFSLQKGHPELALLCSTKPYFFSNVCQTIRGMVIHTTMGNRMILWWDDQFHQDFDHGTMFWIIIRSRDSMSTLDQWTWQCWFRCHTHPVTHWILHDYPNHPQSIFNKPHKKKDTYRKKASVWPHCLGNHGCIYSCKILSLQGYHS